MPRVVSLPAHFPTGAWMWQQAGSDPAAFGHDWFSKVSKDGAALPLPGVSPPNASEGRQDNHGAKSFPKPWEAREVPDRLLRLRITCWTCRLQELDLAFQTHCGASTLLSAFCGSLPSSSAALVLPQKATWTLPTAAPNLPPPRSQTVLVAFTAAFNQTGS